MRNRMLRPVVLVSLVMVIVAFTGLTLASNASVQRSPLAQEAKTETQGETADSGDDDKSSTQSMAAPSDEGSDNPQLVKPEHETGGTAVTLIWTWAGELGEDEWFELQIWPDKSGAMPQVFGWYKVTEKRITTAHLPPGRYWWQVMVVRGKSEERTAVLSSFSESRIFILTRPSVLASISITPPPAPTRTPTPTPKPTKRVWYWWPTPTKIPTPTEEPSETPTTYPPPAGTPTDPPETPTEEPSETPTTYPPPAGTPTDPPETPTEEPSETPTTYPPPAPPAETPTEPPAETPTDPPVTPTDPAVTPYP